MKSALKYLFFGTFLCLNACYLFEEDGVRKVSCIQPGEYEYLKYDWIDSICTTEICSTYTAVWKELFIKRNNMTEGYFDKHISIFYSAVFISGGEKFEIGYRVQNDWAIAETWDMFVILTAVVWIVALVARGHISINFAGFALLIVVICLALGRSLGGNLGRLVRLLFRIGLPLASLLTLSVMLGGGDLGDMMGILSGLAVLCVVLAGLYIMLSGLFSMFRSR